MFHRQDCKWMGDASAGTTGREDPTLTIPQVVTLACNVYLFIYVYLYMTYVNIYIYVYMYIEMQKPLENTCIEDMRAHTHLHIHTHRQTCSQANTPTGKFSNLGVWYSYQEGWAFCSCSGFWNPLLRLSMVAFVAWPWRSSVLVTRRYPQNQKQWHGRVFQKRCFNF